MSLELKDLRCKIQVTTWAWLCAEARGRGVDPCEIVREVLGDWAGRCHRVASEAHTLLHAEGLPGIDGGRPGKIRDRQG